MSAVRIQSYLSECQQHTCEKVIHNSGMEQVGKRIRKLREDRKLTQDQVAEVLGVTQGAITALELWKSKRPAALTLIKLAKYFDVDAEWLLTGKGHIAPATSLSPDEGELLVTFRALSPGGQAYAMEWMRNLFAQERRTAMADYGSDTGAHPRPKAPEPPH
jgi:transcriptional regulator with XRE-family HTH domain